MKKEGDTLTTDLIYAAVTFSLGTLIAFSGYLIASHTLRKKPELYASSTIIRQIVQVLYFVAVYFIGKKTDANIIYLLVGAASGITLPMFYFTKKLVKQNDATEKNQIKESDSNG